MAENRRTNRALHFSLAIFWFGSILLFWSACRKEGAAEIPIPPMVEVVEVTGEDVPVYIEWIASTDGFVNATIRAQVQGYLIARNYTEGDLVRKGQVLFEIDPRPFQAASDQSVAAEKQAKAALSRAHAALQQAEAEVVQAEARYATAKSNLDRVRPLAARNAVSQKDFDDALGAERTGNAAVQAAQAAVAAAQAFIEASQASLLAAEAAVEKARLDLSFTKIISPIEGIAGIAKAQIGNLVGPGSIEELTIVSMVNPIRVYIPVSEKEYLRNAHNNGRGTHEGTLELILADRSVHPYKGAFAFTDRQVDARTGTIKVAALFPNPGNILRPGQFARVRSKGNVKKGALLVPQRAVTELQGTYQVAVVGPENKIDIRPVKAGDQIGNRWIIDEGLNPGEKVVVEGLQKARQGAAVTPKPFAALEKSAPKESPQEFPAKTPPADRAKGR